MTDRPLLTEVCATTTPGDRKPDTVISPLNVPSIRLRACSITNACPTLVRVRISTPAIAPTARVIKTPAAIFNAFFARSQRTSDTRTPVRC